MTIVVGCRFSDGAVLIADSRATWETKPAYQFEDILQKVLYFTPRMAVAFAGDVLAAAYVIESLRARQAGEPRLQDIYRLVGDVPRAARRFYEEYKQKNKSATSISLVFAGLNEAGKPEIFHTHSPHFARWKLEDKVVVAGSGDFVKSFILQRHDHYDKLPDLKTKTDTLITDLSGELQRNGIPTVGGMFQTLLLDKGGIRGLTLGFTDLSLQGPPEARRIELSKGRWIQRDLVTGQTIPLVEPKHFIGKSPKELRVHDFKMPEGEAAKPKWHLTYFMTCLKCTFDTGTSAFEHIISTLMGYKFPISQEVIAAIGFWGSSGDHEVELVQESETGRKSLGKQILKLEYLPEEKNFVIRFILEVEKPGPLFLEVLVGGVRIGRRALFFRAIDAAPPADKDAALTLMEAQSKLLFAEQAASADAVLEKAAKAELVYFAVCMKCTGGGGKLAFEGQFVAAFSRSYPVKMRMCLAAAIRAPKGGHNVEIAFVHAATRETFPVASAVIETVSSLVEVPIQDDVDVVIPKTGLYFLSLSVDKQIIGSRIIAMELPRGEFSYTLPPADEARVQNGEVIVLLKDSKQQP